MSGRINNNSGVVQLCLILYICNALFKYFLPGSATKILPVSAVFIMLIYYKVTKIRLTQLEKNLVIFGIVWTTGCLYSSDVFKGLGYASSFILAYIFCVVIARERIKYGSILRLIALVCLLFTLGIIVQSTSPDIVANIDQLFSYEASQYADMNSWARDGLYSGFFPDRAPAAFYSLLLIGIGMYYLMIDKNRAYPTANRICGVALIVFGAYGVVLTGKRGLLIGALISALICYMVYRKAHKAEIFKILISTITIIVVVWIIAINSTAAQVILERFFENDNFYTGRLDIYSNMYEIIENNFIFGIGTASAYDALGIGGHNIYLTVLMENGIIGLFFFLLAFILEIINSVRTILWLPEVSAYDALPIMVFSLFIQIFFLVYGMSGNPLYDNYILYFYVFAVLIRRNISYRSDDYYCVPLEMEACDERT